MPDDEGVTDDEIILDIQRIAHALHSNTLSEEQYSQNGGKYPMELINEFGGFSSRCELAGLKAQANAAFGQASPAAETGKGMGRSSKGGDRHAAL